MENPDEVASKVLRRAQVSKVSIDKMALIWYQLWIMVMLITNYADDQSSPRPSRPRQCQDTEWLAEYELRCCGGAGGRATEEEAASVEQRHNL